MMEGNYSNVGHRGPVYNGLGTMNPCDNLYNRPREHKMGTLLAENMFINNNLPL
jgi:hypothetical protein